MTRLLCLLHLLYLVPHCRLVPLTAVCDDERYGCDDHCVCFGNRILDKVPSGAPFITLAFVVRIFEGIGAASFLTASYTLMAREFPDRVATTFVSVYLT